MVCPLTFDQPFWGRRVFSLGCGPKPRPLKRLSAERFARGLIELIQTESYRHRAREVASAIAEEDGVPAGFVEIVLRNLVDGCRTSPVAYLEAIFVEPQFRGRGIGRQLLNAAEDWARKKGCTEFATDTTIEDLEAQGFHRHVGFEDRKTL